jgi:hypothetical protein
LKPATTRSPFEAGREAHLSGEIAKALMAKADKYLSAEPIIHKITLIAEK